MSSSETAGTDAVANGRRSRRHRNEPLTVHYEFVVVDGDAGKELGRHQAAAIRKVLEWLHENSAASDQDRAADEGAGQ